MAAIKILTNSKCAGVPVAAAGTEVLVGDAKVDRVTSINLGARVGDLWELQLTVLVDPNTLFETLPEKA